MKEFFLGMLVMYIIAVFIYHFRAITLRDKDGWYTPLDTLIYYKIPNKILWYVFFIIFAPIRFFLFLTRKN